MAEKHIEKKCCELAEAYGWKHRKFTSPGRRGAMDHIFVRKGVVLFIEFKQPGEPMSSLQEIEYKDLNAHGAYAFVCDSVEYFLGLIREFSNPLRS